MKFWQRIFIGALVIFIAVFDAGALYLVSYSYNFSRRREQSSGIREHEVVLSSLEGRIASLEAVYLDASGNDERLLTVISPLAGYYRQQGGLMTLYNGRYPVYAGIPEIDERMLDFAETGQKNTMEAFISDKRHVIVASKLPSYPHLTFVYARDISGIDDLRDDFGRAFIFMNAATLAVLGVLIYLLLRRLTKPITDMTAAAAEIAGGAYDKRVSINGQSGSRLGIGAGGDELQVLADSFNRMADSVEEQMRRLMSAASMRQQFIDDLTHEMRTPLTSILGYSEYLQSAKCTEKERNIATGHLYYMANRLKNLSDKLAELTFLRGERIDMRPVEAKELFRDLQVSALPLLIPRSVTLNISCELEILYGDETLLLSMLINLVENAGRASQEGSEILVKSYRLDKNPVIEVIDSGHGMEQEDIEKITEPFFRVDKSRSRKFGGIGLGMSIVSQIAALHNAKLEIKSAPGKGTTVRIRFADHASG